MSVKYVAMKLISFVDKGSYSNIVLMMLLKNSILQLKKKPLLQKYFMVF